MFSYAHTHNQIPKSTSPSQLEGVWFNGHIRELLEEERGHRLVGNGAAGPLENGHDKLDPRVLDDPTVPAPRDAPAHAEKAIEAASLALRSRVESSPSGIALRAGPFAPYKAAGEVSAHDAFRSGAVTISVRDGLWLFRWPDIRVWQRAHPVIPKACLQ